MRGAGGEAKRGWKGSILGTNRAEFGEERWSVELGILRWKRVGFCVNFWVVGGKCWVGSLCGMGGCVVRSLGEIRGPIPSDFGGVLASVCSRTEGEKILVFSGWRRGSSGFSPAGDYTRERGWSSLGCFPHDFLFLLLPPYRSTERSFSLQVCRTATINCRWQEHGHEAAHAGPVLAASVRAQAWSWQELAMAGGSQSLQVL